MLTPHSQRPATLLEALFISRGVGSFKLRKAEHGVRDEIRAETCPKAFSLQAPATRALSQIPPTALVGLHLKLVCHPFLNRLLDGLWLGRAVLMYEPNHNKMGTKNLASCPFMLAMS
jgi:hypothetical protein